MHAKRFEFPVFYFISLFVALSRCKIIECKRSNCLNRLFFVSFRFVFGYSFDRCTLFYHFHVYCHWSRALCFYLMHRCFTCARLNCLGCDRFVFRKQLLVWNCERERGNICLLRIVHNYQMHKTHTYI